MAERLHSLSENSQLPHTETAKHQLGEKVRKILDELGFTIVDSDLARPWGGFFRIDHTQAPDFADIFFHDTEFSLPEDLDVSPKILLVAPETRLSWQVHERRAEFWRAISKSVGYKVHTTDEEPSNIQILRKDETLVIPQRTRHRLIGLHSWGIVAEAWIHTDPFFPSNEEDNRRIQDDFKRT